MKQSFINKRDNVQHAQYAEMMTPQWGFEWFRLIEGLMDHNFVNGNRSEAKSNTDIDFDMNLNCFVDLVCTQHRF